MQDLIDGKLDFVTGEGRQFNVVDVLTGAIDYSKIIFHDIDAAIMNIKNDVLIHSQMTVEVAQSKVMTPNTVLEEVTESIVSNAHCKEILEDPKYLECYLYRKLQDLSAGNKINIETLQWCYDKYVKEKDW